MNLEIPEDIALEIFEVIWKDNKKKGLSLKKNTMGGFYRIRAVLGLFLTGVISDFKR